MPTTKPLSMTPRNVRRRQIRDGNKAAGMTRRPKAQYHSLTPPIVSAIPAPAKTIRNHFILLRDCSGSMSVHASGARKLFAEQLRLLRESSAKDGQENTATVFDFGAGGPARERCFYARMTYGSTYHFEDDYTATGPDTPLFDAVATAIQRATSFGFNDDTSHVVIILTDGEENASKFTSAPRLCELIADRQKTDRWTFAFLVPPGYKTKLVRLLGVPDGNVQEWSDAREAEIKTSGATRDFLHLRRTSGGTYTKSAAYFTTDASKIGARDLASLYDITNDVKVHTVTKETTIEPFVRYHHNSFTLGRAYYELMKKEKQVQDYKKILLQDKSTGRVYDSTSTVTVRDLLGLPNTGDIKLDPGNHANYRIFVQSMSVNRILPRGTKLVYWS